MLEILFFAIGVGLLLHHGWTHYLEPEPSNARKESCCLVCYFQPKDILHYESWSLICLTSAFWVVLASVSGGDSEVLSIYAVLLVVFEALFVGYFHYEEGSERGLKLHNSRNHETWLVLCFLNGCVVLVLFYISTISKLQHHPSQILHTQRPQHPRQGRILCMGLCMGWHES